MLEDKTVFVTGGCGSIGSSIIKRLLEYERCKPIIVFDNAETALFNLELELENPNVKFCIGDVRDRESLMRSIGDAQVVFHCAALKHVSSCELAPIEAVKTNVLGTRNVIETAKKCGAEKFLMISTDKAVYPISVMGATKLLAEKVTLLSNSDRMLCSVIRLGNVLGSAGSVTEIWLKQCKAKKPLTVTDKRMYRFFISMKEAVNQILHAIEVMRGGEIFIPKMEELSVYEMAREIASEFSREIKFIGARRGERLRERLMTDEEKEKAEELDGMWVIRE